MKYLITILALLFLHTNLFAGTSCKEDWTGTIVCTGTGSDAGYNYEVDTDWTGTDRYRDNRGNTMSCKTDWTGAYVCD